MSNRTLIEINHDFAHEIGADREVFVAALMHHLRSIPYSKLPMEIFPGVRVIGARHHSEPYSVRWGAYTEEVGTLASKEKLRGTRA